MMLDGPRDGGSGVWPMVSSGPGITQGGLAGHYWMGPGMMVFGYFLICPSQDMVQQWRMTELLYATKSAAPTYLKLPTDLLYSQKVQVHLSFEYKVIYSLLHCEFYGVASVADGTFGLCHSLGTLRMNMAAPLNCLGKSYTGALMLIYDHMEANWATYQLVESHPA